MQQNYKSQSTSYFSRWSRKSYAVFNSLNKVVKISGLSVAITAVMLPNSVVAQEENPQNPSSDYYLDEVELVEPELLQVFEVPSRVISVISSRELQSAPIESVQDVLNSISQIDLRQRGNNDVQADISIRGGTFDQVLIMLNGINITNPQTGHHNLDLPISFDQIERVEILNGAGSQSFGANAYSGVINIITKSSSENTATAKAIVGDFGLYNFGASANLVGRKQRHFIAVNHDQSSGYTDNTDFTRTSLYYNGKYILDKSFFQWQMSFADKAFGAQSFYTAKYPNQFEQTQTALASLKFKSFGNVSTTSQVYWHLHSDRFELFRNNENAPSWYKNHNYHLTNVMGGNTKALFTSFLGNTTIGLDLRYEHIASNVLGEPTGEDTDAWFNPSGFYNKEASRLNTSVSVEQSYKYKGFSTIVALMVNNNTAYDKINFYPGVDLNYDFNNHLSAKASFNKSLRLPTFTDLYYAGPSNIGNPDLLPEESVNFDFGINYTVGILNLNLTSFNNFGTNNIDWVKKPDADKWQPMNLTNVETYGIDASANIRLGNLQNNDFFIENISIQYTYIDKQVDIEGYSSNYVNDYLKQKFVFGINHKIYQNFSANWKLRYQQRNGNYMLWDADAGKDILTPYGDYTMVDTRVNWNSKGWQLFADVKNIFNVQYVDYGNVLQPGRWFSLGVKKEFDL